MAFSPHGSLASRHLAGCHAGCGASFHCQGNSTHLFRKCQLRRRAMLSSHCCWTVTWDGERFLQTDALLSNPSPAG